MIHGDGKNANNLCPFRRYTPSEKIGAQGPRLSIGWHIPCTWSFRQKETHPPLTASLHPRQNTLRSHQCPRRASPSSSS
jgi:hypothetical protein